MPDQTLKSPAFGAWCEAGLAAAIGAAILSCALFFRHAGYLPQPFLYDVGAPLIGLYETTFWAHHAGTYGVGRNIYPPLSFVVARMMSLRACYALSPAAGRACDPLALGVLLAFFTANIVLIFRAYRALGAVSAAARTVAVALGLPMLYALECGNVIILAFTAFVLGYGEAARSGWARRLALVAAINFKPYLLIVLIPPAIRRQWRWLAATCAAGAALYALTWALEAGGSPAELLHNLFLYASAVAHRPWSDVYYATSYWPLIHYLGPTHPALAALATLAMRLAQAGVAVSLIAAIRRPQSVDPARLSAMILAMALTTLATGQSGYVQIFLFYLLFREPWRGPARIVILVTAYILCIPADLRLAAVVHGVSQSVLSGRAVATQFGLSVGQILRPAGLLVIQFGLIYLNLADSLAAGRSGHAAAPAMASVAARRANR